ncbi:MAG: MerR family transcriptional regulator [Bryobacteraceae bacterium]
MWNVTETARRLGLSRGTLLYYESIGLLKPPARSASNYRRYGDRDLQRLELICAYRKAGLTLEDIRTILDRRETDASAVLKRRLIALDHEIETLRAHQRAILNLLKTNTIGRQEMITKEKWVSIMKAAGLTEADMHRWHAEFERAAPEEHQEFLQFLHIPQEEIRTIREASRK